MWLKLDRVLDILITISKELQGTTLQDGNKSTFKIGKVTSTN